MDRCNSSTLVLRLTKFSHCVRYLVYMEFQPRREIDTNIDLCSSVLSAVIGVVPQYYKEMQSPT